ncbi:hypothetical protein ScPMuIL_013887 [Solemya velum]
MRLNGTWNEAGGKRRSENVLCSGTSGVFKLDLRNFHQLSTSKRLSDYRNKKMGDAAYKTLKNVLLVLFIFYVGIPVFIRTNPWIQNKLVFLNMLRWPLFMDFTKPHELGLMATRNFYLQEDRDNRLGLCPTNQLGPDVTRTFYRQMCQHNGIGFGCEKDRQYLQSSTMFFVLQIVWPVLSLVVGLSEAACVRDLVH